jgi:hypothetical protein
MTAKVILTLLLFVVLAYALTAARQAKLLALLFVLLSTTGAYFVWFPSDANRLANAVGVGRGADLVLYLWVIVSFLAIINLHLKLKSQLGMLTKIARALALYEARNSGSQAHKDGRV